LKFRQLSFAHPSENKPLYISSPSRKVASTTETHHKPRSVPHKFQNAIYPPTSRIASFFTRYGVTFADLIYNLIF
jgi:hypothetical protein